MTIDGIGGSGPVFGKENPRDKGSEVSNEKPKQDVSVFGPDSTEQSGKGQPLKTDWFKSLRNLRGTYKVPTSNPEPKPEPEHKTETEYPFSRAVEMFFKGCEKLLKAAFPWF